MCDAPAEGAVVSLPTEVHMRAARTALIFTAAAALAVAGSALTTATANSTPSSTLVTVGSPPTPFSQNKQNEPAVAVDANNPSVLAAGSNEEIDMEQCAAGNPATCPFTQGVGVSGIYFSYDSGTTWTQPTYTGLTARDCPAVTPCTAVTGPIGTLPNYADNGLVSDGDPALAFGPRLGSDGKFSYENGSRLYYANLTSNVSTTRTDAAFKGFEAIAVSYTDHTTQAHQPTQNSDWSAPTLISKQSSTTFSDKEQLWADNAASSAYFGSVYVCWASFRSNSHGMAFPTPLYVSRSRDGGVTWTTSQVGPATDNGINSQPDGCTIRTDSKGGVYVFGVATRNGTTYEAMYKSTDGGAKFGPLQLVAPAVAPGKFDPALGRPVMDGIAGFRVDLAVGPSVDIANGAPSGADATDQIVLTWSDGAAGINNEKLMLTTSRDGGATWTTPSAIGLQSGDRPVYTAPAISPNGTDVYVVYNALTTTFQTDTTSPRNLTGALLHADVSGGVIGTFAQVARGPDGDPRGTSQNGLTAEFIGDYVYAAATRSYGTAVWNDASNAAPCDAINSFRADVESGGPATAPDVQGSCPATFGNSDIRGVTVAAP